MQEKKESKTRKQQKQDENWEQNSVKKKDKNTREDILENSGLCKKQSNQSLLQKKKKKKTETTSKDCQWRSLIWQGEIKITDPRQGGKRNSNNNKWEKKNNQSDLNVVYKCKNLMPNLFAREREISGTLLSSAGAVVATNVTQKLPPASSSQTWQGERKETTIAMRYCSCIKLQGGHEAAAANSQIPILGGHEIDQQLGKVTK